MPVICLLALVRSPPSPLPVLECCFLVCWTPPINRQNDSSLLSASLCWSSDSCHFTWDWCLDSLSERSLFYRLLLIIFLVRCSVSVSSSSSGSSFVFFIDRFYLGPRELSSLSSLLHCCGVSDHQSYGQLKFLSDISLRESVFVLIFVYFVLFLQFFCSSVWWVEMTRKWFVFFANCCLAVWTVSKIDLFSSGRALLVFDRFDCHSKHEAINYPLISF